MFNLIPLSVSTLWLTFAVFSWAAPAIDPLEPIETLAPPVPRNYLAMRDVRYIEEKAEVQYVIGAYKMDENILISNFLKEFDRIKRKVTAQDMYQALDTMKLMIVHSWLHSLTPDRGLLTGIIRIGDDVSLSKVKEKLAIEIQDINKRSSVADTIFLYKKFMEKNVQSDFASRLRTLETGIETKIELIEGVSGNEKFRLTEEKQSDLKKLDEYRMLAEFLPFAFQMCLHSYVLNFGKNPLGNTFLLESSSGSDRLEFKVPPLITEQFEMLLLDEGFGDDGEYIQFKSNLMKNIIISKYLIMFEDIIMKSESPNVHESLIITRQMILQSWIHTMKPDIDLLRDVLPTVKPRQKLVQVKLEIANGLKEITKEPVEDAIIYYVNSMKQKIQDGLDIKIKVLTETINRNLEILKKLDIESKKDALRKIIIRDIENVEEHKLFFNFHRVTPIMCLQSYVLDFLTAPYGDSFVITSTSGLQKTFLVPPLDGNSFEELSYQSGPAEALMI